LTHKKRKYDILCVGELLVDCISDDFVDDIEEVKSFKRFQGGSPANLSLNMAKLGNNSTLIACIGNDDNGDFLLQSLESNGMDCTHIKRSRLPSSLILITRSKKTAKSKSYRGADTQISEDQLSEDLLQSAKIFHTTCFALSKNPAQHYIIKAAHLAQKHDCQLSIDLNYVEKIWHDRAAAQKIVADYCALGALVKLSEVDWERLYDQPVLSNEAVIQHFMDLGAKEVCLTLGSEGCVAAQNGTQHFLPARKVNVKNTTGTGDAFWSGYLTAWLDGLGLEEKLKAGRKMAEIRLAQIGAIKGNIPKDRIYDDF